MPPLFEVPGRKREFCLFIETIETGCLGQRQGDAALGTENLRDLGHNLPELWRRQGGNRLQARSVTHIGPGDPDLADSIHNDCQRQLDWTQASRDDDIRSGRIAECAGLIGAKAIETDPQGDGITGEMPY